MILLVERLKTTLDHSTRSSSRLEQAQEDAEDREQRERELEERIKGMERDLVTVREREEESRREQERMYAKTLPFSRSLWMSKR